MRIKLRELEHVLAQTLRAVESIEGDEIEIDDGLYWEVLTKDRYDPYRKPVDLGLGSIAGHVETLNRVSSGELDPYPLLLLDVAEILRQIGEIRVSGLK